MFLELVDEMWAVHAADGRLPVSVPQSGWAAGMQHEVCDYVRRIKVEHRQCLEEAQRENETAGEPPPPGGKRGTADPHGAPLLRGVSPDPHHIHCTLLERRAGSCWVLRRGCWEKTGNQTEEGGSADLHVPIPNIWGAPRCHLRREYKLGFGKVHAANSAFGGPCPSPGNVGTLSLAASPSRMGGQGTAC